MRRTLWKALARQLGLRLVIHRCEKNIPKELTQTAPGDVGYEPGVIHVHLGTYEPWVAHEFAHWLVSSEKDRQTINYGDSDEVLAGDITVGLWALFEFTEPSVEEVLQNLCYDGYPDVDKFTRQAKELLDEWPGVS